ncbi:MAG: bifunctional DNA-formamidopyrimidine glycosylase/DNA-(apurinic or apyrimidinic site) lyase [Candidatus Pacebacteria bacterium]|nr:bifunctional DNA-formamidopyrimidine glycosylase/DNA-(apurinic or apyrimidinic site) lyase [Candidatus Paceibacterota bacterium]
MPELPEVQTIVNELNEKIKGKVIKDVWVGKEKLIKNFSVDKLKEKKILKVSRRAKYIIIELSDNYILLVHLKMTGHFLLGKWKIENKESVPLIEGPIKDDPYNSYVHIIFYLDSGEELGFSDLRQFGKMELYKKDEILNLKEIKELGPEPFSEEFTLDYFQKIVKGKKTDIKKLLMDQEKIAGIGNIYGSEILFLAKVNPQRKTETLSDKEIENIFNAIKIILKRGLELKGTSMSDYRRLEGGKGNYQSEVLVYGRKGLKCRDCNELIKYVKIGARGTFYCPNCQK